MTVYTGDSSGISPQPHCSSTLAPKDRYCFQNRKHIVNFFNENGQKDFAIRYLILLARRIQQANISNDWVEYDDLYTIVKALLIEPAIEALCGPVLIEQNPDFAKDFWKFDSDILYFFKAYPRWCIPGAYRNRTKLLQNTKDWHAFARDHFHESSIEADGHDRLYGSPLMRSRQVYLTKIDALDADALASQDLGLLWAENANSIPAVFWMAYEALQRPHLIAQAMDQIDALQPEPAPLGTLPMNVEDVCNIPLLQSMFAETLRLYTSLFALRSAAHGDFQINDLKVPKAALIGVDSRVAAMDERIWNSENGTDRPGGIHAVDRFWPERFLGYPDESGSGALRFNTTRPKTSDKEPQLDVHHSGAHFSLDGLAGAWLPFGGGSRQCPGRSFAKQEIMLGFAMMFSNFEIHLLDTGKAGPRKPDMRYYGLGTLPPKGKVPFRIRKRIVRS